MKFIFIKSKIARELKKRRALIVLIALFVLIYDYSSKNSQLIDKESNSKEKDSQNPNCNIFINNPKFYRVNFNGSIYPKSNPLSLNKSINFDCLQKTRKIKRIFLWNAFFGDRSHGHGFGVETPFKKLNCPVTKCELTNDLKMLDDSDLVMVHMVDSIPQIPKHRPKNQRWMFLLIESPEHTAEFSRYNGIFNYTVTYRIDSDFAHSYEADSLMYWIKNLNFDENYDFYSDKTQFAAALISNCGGSSKRLKYIAEMQKYVKVNIFGRCGQQCPEKYNNSQPGDCKSIIGKDFKFYLAFENSICKDYITEKFFLMLKHNIILVVLGGGNYEHYLPKSAYIDVKDFESPKKLAEYLIYLDSNKEAYNAYFKWKKHVSFLDNAKRFNPICNMCVQLHLEDYIGIKEKVYKNIEDYWRKDACTIPEFEENGKFFYKIKN